MCGVEEVFVNKKMIQGMNELIKLLILDLVLQQSRYGTSNRDISLIIFTILGETKMRLNVAAFNSYEIRAIIKICLIEHRK